MVANFFSTLRYTLSVSNLPVLMLKILSLLELVAYMDKNMKIVECGGVQVRNCVLRPIPWKINNKIPLNQKNIFSPFTTPQEKVSYIEYVNVPMPNMIVFFNRFISWKFAEIIHERRCSTFCSMFHGQCRSTN